MNSTLDVLEEALRERLELRKADGLEAFLEAGSDARYLREPALTIALHFDIEPAFLILDPLLGVLGVVESVAKSPLEAGASVADRVRRAVDRATYLRHLIMRDPELKSRRPLSVELVLFTGEEAGDGLAEIGAVLRKTLRESSSLFHIGISVLSHAGPERGVAELRRAFPWLLRATRRWLESPRAKAAERPASVRVLRHLQLTHYRLPGVRKLKLADAPVHLVHGPNGSGKSSIAEALELIASGKIERLEQAGERNYDGVIRNRLKSQGDALASVQLGWVDRARKVTEFDDLQVIRATGIERPLSPNIDASSFRLDQPLMDRLVGNSPHARARTLLRAFFPEAVATLSDYELATQKHDEALGKLRSVSERLESARTALRELQNWRTTAAVATGEDYPAVLNRWLEQTALLDLIQRARTLRDSVTGALAAGWRPSEQAGNVLSQFGVSSQGSDWTRLEKECKERVDQLQGKLDSFAAAVTAAPAAPSSAANVSPAAVEALNAVSPFLIEPTALSSFGLLGHKLAGVINAGAPATYGPTVIGADKWAEPLLKILDSLIAACTALHADVPLAGEWPGVSPCTEYDQARASHAFLLEKGQELNRRFVDKLLPDQGANGEFDGSLIAAVNELMALFTPARWAYDDIELQNKLNAGQLGVTMGLSDGGRLHRAELHLNTAELNLFTVALFLLCSGRVAKPLNLLVFDDPLQNMDELTATALARGIGKLVRLWASMNRGEELLFLFHGNDDLERFHAELAGALYRLPWLTPAELSHEDPLTAEQCLDVLAVQQLRQLKLKPSD